jgi:2-octaprenyl-6-methoxyphenol hydroxylase
MKTKAPKNPKSFDVAISGAGPAGLMLGLLLSRARLACAVFDPTKPERASAPSGRTSALLNQSIALLKTLGIWEGLETHCAPLQTMRIIDDSQGDIKPPPQVTFNSHDLGEAQFGYNIPNTVLRECLFALTDQTPALKLFMPDKILGYQTDSCGVTLETQSGQTIRARLLVGTDGRNSVVRTIAGIETQIHDYQQTAITCLIKHSKPHHFTSTEFHRNGGPFTLVPLPAQNSSVVWVEKTDDAMRFLSMPKGAFEKALQDRTKGILGEVHLKTSPESWPLIELSSKRLTAARIALAGEAAHVLSPIGAQGLNLSIRDVAALAETLVDAARLGLDIGADSVLNRYERRRHTDISTRVSGIDGLNRIVSTDHRMAQDLRRLGLKSLETIKPLKHFAMMQGLSPSLDESRLLKGQAL